MCIFLSPKLVVMKHDELNMGIVRLYVTPFWGRRNPQLILGMDDTSQQPIPSPLKVPSHIVDATMQWLDV